MSPHLRSVVDVAAGAKTRAVIYCRISQDRTGAGLGVDRQREDCQALAERNGWDVVEVYVDNDVSAFSGKLRKDYRRMLADLDQGAATVVIVWHTDRLTRSIVELEEYIELSDRRGIATHTVQAGTIDLATPSGRMTARILGAVALVGIIVLLVLRGNLVPRRQIEDLRTDKDRQIEDLRGERDTWRQAHTVSEEARREAQDQAGEMLEMSRTAGYFFNALPQPRRSREVNADAGMDQQAASPPT